MSLLVVYPEMGLVYTGHRRTLAKRSNDILIGLTDKGNTLVTIYYQFTVYEIRL